MIWISFLIIIILLIVLIQCMILSPCNRYPIEHFSQNNAEDYIVNKFKKPILWSYWEQKSEPIRANHALRSDKKEPPPYIILCFKTFEYKCSKLFDIKILNEKTVYDYIPNLRKDLNQLGLATKSDYIRIALLFYYGGIWLDADTIVMSNMKEVLDKLNEGWDYIGFGCTGRKCMVSGYPRPSNGAMASQKGSILMKNILIELDRSLDEYFLQKKENRKHFGYFDLGKIIIWKEINKLISQGYNYYHFPSYVDGSRDVNGKWIAPNLIFKNNIDLMDKNKLIIVFLANSMYCGNDIKYNWFCNLTEKEILEGSYFVSSLFRKSLDYKL